MELGQYDAYLVIVPSIQDAYFAAGVDYPLSDSQITDFMDRYLYQDLVDGKTGQGVLALCGGLNDYYVSNFGTGSADSGYTYDDYGADDGSALVGLLVMLVILLVILSVIDRLRYSSYRQRYYGVANPPFVFRPLLFWHGPLLWLVSPPLASAPSPASPWSRRPPAARRTRQLWGRPHGPAAALPGWQFVGSFGGVPPGRRLCGSGRRGGGLAALPGAVAGGAPQRGWLWRLPGRRRLRRSSGAAASAGASRGGGFAGKRDGGAAGGSQVGGVLSSGGTCSLGDAPRHTPGGLFLI